MNEESAIQARIMLAHGARADRRLFRNTVGEGWQGRVVRRRGDEVVLAGARYVTFGLAPGSADLIGWRSVEILPADVGRRIGQFLAVEVKTATGRASDAQRQFLAAVTQFGGCAGIARAPDDVDRIIKEDIA